MANRRLFCPGAYDQPSRKIQPAIKKDTTRPHEGYDPLSMDEKHLFLTEVMVCDIVDQMIGKRMVFGFISEDKIITGNIPVSQIYRVL